MGENKQGYSKYLVIFIDILGSKSRTEFNELYKINSIFHETFEKNENNNKSHTVYFRKIYTFSDCAYIFYGFKDGINDEKKDLSKLFTVALCNCEPIFLRFLKEKIIFRGGITYGDAYVDLQRSMFFGEAINQAYELESKKAIHPRIIVDKFVALEVENNIMKQKHNLINNNLVIEGLMPYLINSTGDGIIEKDIDGNYIFNYLHTPERGIAFPEYYVSCDEFFKELFEYSICQIQKNTEYRVIDKYYYLLRFVAEKYENFKKIKKYE